MGRRGNNRKKSGACSNICWVFGYLRPWRGRYCLGLATCAVDDYVCTLLVTLLSGNLLQAAQQGRIEGVWQWALVGVAVYAGYMALAARGRILFETACKRATAAMREDLYAKILTQPPHGGAGVHTGQMLNRLNSSVSYAGELYQKMLLKPLGALFSLTLGFITVAAISWECALLLAGLGLLMLLMNLLFIKPMNSRFGAMFEAREQTVTHMSDLLAGAETVRIYNEKTGLLQRFFDSCQAALNKGIRAWNLQSVGNAVGQLQRALTTAIGVGLGFWLFYQGRIGLAAVPLLWGMRDLVVDPLSRIGFMAAEAQEMLAGARQVVELYRLPDENTRHKGGCRFTPVSEAPAVQAQELSFSFEGQRVFTNKSFAVPQGRIWGVVGPSGCGKSTLLRILMGLEEYEGSLQVFGRELRSLALEEIRALTSFVPQDSLLLDGTIFENIQLGDPQADNEQVLAAARAAGVEDFIADLPDGYQTQVGERGGQLSGGQRQRVAVARALLKKAPILLLDEPTASLDSVSEQYMRSTLMHLKGNRTILVVTHSRTLVSYADGVLLF